MKQHFPFSVGRSLTRMAHRDDKLFTTLLTVSPAGDELVLDFAKSLITNEELGSDETPDYLSVSFSSTDYVGHILDLRAWKVKTTCCGWTVRWKNCFALLMRKSGSIRR